jgi:urea transport system ATP-binding protein
MTEYEISHLGIGRKFQKPTVFFNHTVFENLELALQAKKDVWSSLTKTLTGEQKDLIEKDLETIGLTEQMNLRAGLLSHGQKQWLEIGMLLVQNPKLLLIDEPVAGMTHQETERTAELLASLAGKHSVVVVEHDMDFIRSIANRVTVLHEGSVLAEGKMEDVQKDPKVMEVYLGS